MTETANEYTERLWEGQNMKIHGLVVSFLHGAHFCVMASDEYSLSTIFRVISYYFQPVQTFISKSVNIQYDDAGIATLRQTNEYEYGNPLVTVNNHGQKTRTNTYVQRDGGRDDRHRPVTDR